MKLVEPLIVYLVNGEHYPITLPVGTPVLSVEIPEPGLWKMRTSMEDEDYYWTNTCPRVANERTVQEAIRKIKALDALGD